MITEKNYVKDERIDDILRIRVRYLTEEAAACAAQWGIQPTRDHTEIQTVVREYQHTPAPASDRRRGELRFG